MPEFVALENILVVVEEVMQTEAVNYNSSEEERDRESDLDELEDWRFGVPLVIFVIPPRVQEKGG